MAQNQSSSLEKLEKTQPVDSQKLKSRVSSPPATPLQSSIILNAEGKVLSVNESLLKILGHDLDEVLGKSLFDFIHSEDRSLVILTLENISTKSQSSAEMVARLRAHDDRWVVFQAVVELVSGPNDEHEFVLHVHEASDSTQTSWQILRDTEFLRVITEHTRDTIWIMDLEYKTLYISPSVTQIRGFSLEEIQTMQLEQQLEPKSFELAFRTVSEELTPEKLAQKDYIFSRTLELEFYRKDGTTFWSENQFTLLRDLEGHPVGILATGRDISERQLADRALRESEQKYRSLFENIPDSMYRTTPDGHIMAANSALVKLLGVVSEEELIKQHNIIEFFEFESERTEERKIMDKLGYLQGFELHLRKSNGDLATVLDNCRVFRDEYGKIVYYEGTLTDITGLKRSQADLELVGKINTALRTASTSNEMYPLILANALQILGSNDGALFLLDGDHERSHCVFAIGELAGMHGMEIGPLDGIIGNIVSSSSPTVLEVGTTPLAEVLPQEFIKDNRFIIGVPMIAHGQAIGVLILGSLGEITRNGTRLLTIIADIAANAINRSILFEETALRSEQLITINASGRSFVEAGSANEIYRRLYKTILQLFAEMDFLRVTRYDNDKGALARSYTIEDKKEVPFTGSAILRINPEGKDVLSRCILEQKTILLERTPEQTGSTGELAVENLYRAGAQSVIYIPMMARGRVTGVIQAGSRQPGYFTKSDGEMLTILSNTVAIALENADLLQETRQRLSQVQALHEIESTINSSLDLGVIFNVVLGQALKLLNVDAAAIYLFNPQQQTLDWVTGKGFYYLGNGNTRLRVKDSLTGKAVLERRPVHIDNLNSYVSKDVFNHNVDVQGFNSYYAVPLISKGQVNGVLELLNRANFSMAADWLGFLDTLTAQLAIAIDNISLFESLQRTNAELALAYDATLEGWSRTLDLRDKETEGHTLRVAEMTTQLARQMGFSEKELVNVRRGAILHDIGKIGISDSVLLKPGNLSPEERQQIEKHPLLAFDLLRPISFLQPALDIPYCHHEHWDGSGYPRQLKGEAIPLSARIFAVIDVWDALTSDRPYRPAWTNEKAQAYIKEQSGKQFDPSVVQVFLKTIVQP